MVSPLSFLKNNWRPLFLLTHGVTPIFFSPKAGDLFCHRPFYLPSPTFRCRFSSILYKFSHKKIFSFGCHPWMVSPGAVCPHIPSSDVTGLCQWWFSACYAFSAEIFQYNGILLLLWTSDCWDKYERKLHEIRILEDAYMVTGRRNPYNFGVGWANHLILLELTLFDLSWSQATAVLSKCQHFTLVQRCSSPTDNIWTLASVTWKRPFSEVGSLNKSDIAEAPSAIGVERATGDW